MLFGLTYAQFVAVVGGGMLAFDPPPAPPDERTRYILSWGTNAPDKEPVGRDGFLTLEARPSQTLFWGLKPIYAAGLSVDGGGFLSYGVRKDYHWQRLQFTPNFGPTLYQASLGERFQGRQLIQFRTGFDLLLEVTPQLSVGAGVYHISNAKLTPQSAGIDVRRLTLQWRM